MAQRYMSVTGQTAIDQPIVAADQKTVGDFLNNPDPTILPMDTAGVAATPLPYQMVAGSPFPPSAQQRLGHYNRANGNDVPVPAHVVYNSPRNRMTQS